VYTITSSMLEGDSREGLNIPNCKAQKSYPMMINSRIMGFINLASLRDNTGLRVILCSSSQFRVGQGFQRARNRGLVRDFHRESTQGKK